MKRSCLVLTVLILGYSGNTFSQFNWRKAIPKPTQANVGLSEGEITEGLREALFRGTDLASERASIEGGYFRNLKIKIPFPPDAAKVEQRLRAMGMGNQVDKFVRTLNQSAEQAAKQAVPIFRNALRELKFQDAKGILNGGEGAATRYLRSKSERPLQEAFLPIIQQSLKQTTATQLWSELVQVYNRIPGVSRINPNLDQYACERAIVGLFVLIAEEEQKIRTDPAARVSDLLRKVFK